jgi:hypothetical protein
MFGTKIKNYSLRRDGGRISKRTAMSLGGNVLALAIALTNSDSDSVLASNTPTLLLQLDSVLASNTLCYCNLHMISTSRSTVTENGANFAHGKISTTRTYH